MHDDVDLTPEQQATVAEFRAACERMTGSTKPTNLVQILEVARSMYGPRPAESRRRPLTDYFMSEQERLDSIAKFDALVDEETGERFFRGGEEQVGGA
jgi:hypothetical protein